MENGAAARQRVWAPVIRYHDGQFYIYCGDPDRGIFMVRTSDPAGVWDAPVWVVMAQGDSPVNGPHQGAWVDTPGGEHWFLHFQDKDAYGRVVHLQPMEWTDEDWPVIGIDRDGDGVGEPVMKHRKPELRSSGVFQPAESDRFDNLELGLQWQWTGLGFQTKNMNSWPDRDFGRALSSDSSATATAHITTAGG